MRVRVQKWGNSLAVRIPKSFASETELTDGSTADLTIEDGSLVIRPMPRPSYQLGDLLEQVNEKNLHKETDFGWPLGREAW